MPHNCRITDGYETLTRGDVSPAQLFDLCHDLLGRLDSLEWVFGCLTLLTLRHMEIIRDPEDPRAVDATLECLREWMAEYQQAQDKAQADRLLMNLPE